MWPFKKKKSTEPLVPEEVKDYYQSERRERIGVAWLLALATLVTTIILAVGLFFGGRWTYRKIAHRNDKKPSVAVQKPQQPTPAVTATPEQPSTPPSQPTDTQSANNSTSNATPSSGTQTPSASSSPLPSTGPGDTAKVFVVVSGIAGVGHYMVNRRKRQPAIKV